MGRAPVTLPRRSVPALLALCVCCVWLACGQARAGLLLPPGQGVFTGLSGGSSGAFEREVGKHPAVDGVFVTWGRTFESAFGQASFNHARLMLHISTAQGYGAAEQITSRGIAEGAGDGYLLSLSARIVQSGEPVYIRLFPEMDNANNAYCAFNQDGSPRGSSHSTASFIAAWRRVVLIMRGGPVATIDGRLHALKLPSVRGTSAATLPHPRVAFLWVPQTAGSPDTPANGPRPYYPGDAYVDWVGTDFYSRFPNFSGLQRFYSEHPGKPFAFGEWALWGGDSPEWVNQLFSFMASHHQVQMALYNQGERPNGPFRLTQYPRARGALRRRLSAKRFRAFAPEWEAVAHARKSAAKSLREPVHARKSSTQQRPASELARPAFVAGQASYLQMAEVGVARAEHLWRNKRLGWYDSRLSDRDRYPLATIWDVTPLFEALSAIDIAAPSAANRAALMAFASGAERYFDATLRPTPGFAPYPGDRGQTQVWFDDDGWWGLAFLDAYRATGTARYLRDAQRAFAFIAAAGWDQAGGGLWWNTSHPYIAGEPLAAGSLLGALLFKLTGKPFYRDQVAKFLGWAETSFLTERDLYKRTDFDPTPTLYLRAWDGTPITAHQAQPNMLQTDAATLELFAWLAATPE